MRRATMRTFVHVDGFNPYYGMRLVKEQHGKRIGPVTPGTRRPSQQLMVHADFARHVRPGALRQSQLPGPIPGTGIRKPARW